MDLAAGLPIPMAWEQDPPRLTFCARKLAWGPDLAWGPAKAQVDQTQASSGTARGACGNNASITGA